MRKSLPDEKIAIVGYSHRFPGEERGNFWNLLCDGEDLVTEVAPDRWAKETYLHPNKAEPGRAYSFASGSIGDIFGFDNAFFGISPREAAQMDPQQRFLLELAWEAFEKSGIKPSSWRGSDAAVFVGIASTDNVYLSIDDLASIDSTSATGNTNSIAANRLSYIFDLKGPSMSVDTACSSALVAFHQACQAIRCGESGAAIVAGVSLHLHPLGFINFSKTSMLSPEGRCTPFDEEGKGYARSEGAGVILLKRLSDAQKDGDDILAVVAASGVNCDGRTSSLTVPSAEAQAALLKDVYHRAGIRPEEVSYVEAHGTGTQVGDPIEASALSEVLGRRRPVDSPLPIGSVKSNIGHLEAASGIAGLVKALLVLKNRIIPPTIHLKNVNPRIPLKEWGLMVPTVPTSLPAEERLVVGVNSFGFGGANAHVVLESPATRTRAKQSKKRSSTSNQSAPPLFLSARSTEALRELARSYAGYLRTFPDRPLYDLAYEIAHRREWLPQRIAVSGTSAEGMASSLEAWLNSGEDDGVVEGEAFHATGMPVFVFSGNGSQYPGMGRQLLRESPLFRKTVAEIDTLFSKYADYSLLEVLEDSEKESMLRLTEVAQPALFAIQVGLVRLAADQGITPRAVVGHSVGEVAAAWASGALSLEQAVHLIHERSLQQGKTKGSGVMTAVAIGSVALEEILQQIDPMIRPVVAGINSPRSCTLAGVAEALDLCEAILAASGIRFKRLDLDYAFHSPAMDPIRGPLLEDLAGLQPTPGGIPYFSTVTGGKLPGEKLGADYWWRNVRDPVLFAQAIQGLISEGARTFIEIGPHPVLRNYVKECLLESDVDGVLSVTLSRHAGSLAQAKRGFLEMIQSGTTDGFARFFPGPSSTRVSLPSYPWQRIRFETPQTSEAYHLSKRRPEHPLLGYRLKEGAFSWENHLDTLLHPYLADHRVGGVVVFPAAGFVELALASGALRFGSSAVDLEDFEIHAPLILEEKRSKTIRVSLEESGSLLSITSRERFSEEPWVLHASARVLASPTSVSCLVSDACKPTEAVPVLLKAGELYDSAARLGLDYGKAFQTVGEVRIRGMQVEGDLRIPDCIAADKIRYLLHPSELDGALQALLGFLTTVTSTSDRKMAFLPVRCEAFRLHRAGDACASFKVSLRRRTRRGMLADLALFNAQGELVASAGGFRFKAAKLLACGGDHARFLTTTTILKPIPSGRADERLELPSLMPVVGEEFAEREGKPIARQYASEVEPLLELLCSEYAKEAFEAITGGAGGFTLDQLTQSGAVHSSIAPYAASLLRMLLQDGLLRRREDGWYSWIRRAEEPSSMSVWQTLIQNHPEHAEVIRVTGRIGMHLTSIFSGKLDGQDLLPRRWREESPRAIPEALSDFKEVMVRVIDRALSSPNQGGRPRILWMMDKKVLGERILGPWLSGDACDVVMTVPTTQARRDLLGRLEGYPGVEVQVLDAGSLPEPDVLGGKFDFLMVSAEMNSWRTAEEISSLSRLLLPGGTFAFVGKASDRLDDFLFGSAPDRWETDESGLLEASAKDAGFWEKRLKEGGFEDVRPVVCSGGDRSPFLLLASAPSTGSEALLSRETTSWIILFEDEVSASLALSLQELLERERHRVIISPFLDPANYGEFQENDSASKTGVICLVGWTEGQDAGQPQPLVSRLSERILALNEFLKANEDFPVPLPVTVVSRGLLTGEEHELASPEGAALLGYLRVARNEYASANLRVLDVRMPVFEEASEGILREVFSSSDEDEVMIGSLGRGRRVSRVRTASPVASSSASLDLKYLEFVQPGSFSNLKWHSAPRKTPDEGELEIEVRAAGLNFRDVMYAMGLLPDEALENGFAGQTVGMELSGVVTRVGRGVLGIRPGDELIAFAPRAFATHVTTRVEAVMKKPDHWSFEAAATVPTAFFTVYYSLVELARVRSGERILIHGAAGGVGIAAIQMARHLGLEIFATAGSDEKRDFVRMLGADHVLDSRSLSFAEEVLSLTAGEGVDVVLNSLAGEAVVKNLKVLRPFGRFLELGKRDFYENSRVGLRPFRNNIAYHGIDADQLMASNPALTSELFSKITELFDQGVLHPLPFSAFDSSEIAEAFRHMQHSRQIGKVVVTAPGNGVSDVIPMGPSGCLSLSEDATYLITGGTSGFGLRTAEWLAERGARSLVLASRRGVLNDEGRSAVAGLAASGVNVKIVSCDVGSRESLAEMLELVRATMPPLRGVVHSAMIIEDGLLQNLTRSQLERVLHPKVAGSMLLDEMTRGERLDFFVLYSSATTVFGNPGQGAYVAGNMALEALASTRASQGLPATCVAWGPIDDVGYLARNVQIKEALGSRMGGRPLSSTRALEILESLIVQGVSNAVWLDYDWSKLARFLPASSGGRFAFLRNHELDHSLSGGEDRSLREELKGLNRDQAADRIRRHLALAVSDILRMDPSQLDHRKSLYDAGMDSLMAVELAVTLEESLGIKMPMMALSEGPTIQKLAERIMDMILDQDEATSGMSSNGDQQEHLRTIALQHGAEELSSKDIAELSSSLSRSTA